jgi:ACS family hexuronate transporter-like MFS transporter
MLLCAFGVVPIMFAQWVSEVWMAVFILGLATAAHQGFSTNLYTLVSDMFPKRAVASVAGFGGMCGYFGASIFQIFVGYMVVAAPATAPAPEGAAMNSAAVSAAQPNYLAPFIFASVAYLAAMGVIQILTPRMKPAIVEIAAAA